MISRSDLSRLIPLDGSVPAKTFVIEVHTDDPPTYLEEIAPGGVEPTEDAYLWRLSVPEAGEFLVDGLDRRYWSFHTVMPSSPAAAWLRTQVESRPDTDWMWLPSAHLQHIAPGALSRQVRTEFHGGRLVTSEDAAHDLRVQLTGADADQLLEQIAAIPRYRHAVSFHSIEVVLDDPDLGRLREAVRRSGLFAAQGEDFVHHAQFVRTVVGRYARLIEAIEDQALGFAPRPARQHDDLNADAESELPRGASFSGVPIGIRFSRPIADLAAFCDELFSARAPLRLWGRPEVTDDLAVADAVDLHMGHRLGMEIGRDWMRVYLAAGSCGNTVARLVSNLQASFDSALTLAQPSLQMAAALEPVAI
ncbi:MAG TPA: hypothetical protein VK586_12680 [Streptosporangiaceae bacterium]|nr:hypothetical protein [Streptosporangiaceae bacterium]